MKLKRCQIAPWGKEFCVVQTGDWRSERPLFSPERCQYCGQCWLVCPTRSIHLQKGFILEIDLAFCKGCGLCAKECSFRAICMVREQGE